MTPERLLAEFDAIADAPDAIDRLRALVLDLAVRGRLVEQDPEDEPASALLERIAAEKARLVKEKKIRKPKALPDVESEPALTGWRRIRLGSVIELVSGRHLKPSEYNETGDGMPYLTGPADFTSDGPIASRWTTEPQAVAARGDVLITVKGAGVGKLSVASAAETAISRQLMAVRAIGVDANFLRLCLQSLTDHLRSKQVGIAIPGIGRSDLEEAEIDLPPLAEQRRIVARVHELMGLLDELEAARRKRDETRGTLRDAALGALRNAEDALAVERAWSRIAANIDDLFTDPADVASLRQTILQLAVRGRLVEQDPEDEPASALLECIAAEKARLVKEKKIREPKALPPIDAAGCPHDLPNRWSWAYFLRVAEIASNLVDPETDPGAPHIAPNNIEKATGRLLEYRTVQEDGVTSGKHRFYPGQILYSKIRPNLSKAAIVDFSGLCSADMYPINAHIDLQYLLRFMLSDTFLRSVVADDNRLAMPKVNQEQLSRVLVAVPPLAEQRRIVARVDELMAICDELEASLRDAQTAAERFAAAACAALPEAMVESPREQPEVASV